ncbi:MAG: alkyl hydroperoxide reductase/Thiol specific antioxidant/Mal allergen [Sphingobacteriaceae bacterium]|jgi:thiol-disulfide isomerase/thioredoxin|nr:alkyl hydroperoxide reductase/Thiol specific antioxidant/Mal allergen [Sphingobacteriaceae bacterium]
MKRTLLLLLFFAQVSYGQTSYYTFNTDSLFTEERIRTAFESTQKAVPPNYIVVPTIYHRVFTKDSIINYMSFVVEKGPGALNNEFRFAFKQDSVFLLLNKKLPEFKLKDLEGKEFSSSQMLGKPTLINFGATYCGPCIAEMPDLSRLKEKYSEKMNFLGLTENRKVDHKLVSFLNEHPFNYQILQNAEEYKKALKIGAIPRNIFVDRNGYIRYIKGNFPVTKSDSAKVAREYDENNYFVRIIEKLIKE